MIAPMQWKETPPERAATFDKAARSHAETLPPKAKAAKKATLKKTTTKKK